MSFQNIVAQLLQQGMGGQTQQRLQHTASQSGGGLDQMLFPPDPRYWQHIIRI